MLLCQSFWDGFGHRKTPDESHLDKTESECNSQIFIHCWERAANRVQHFGADFIVPVERVHRIGSFRSVTRAWEGGIMADTNSSWKSIRLPRGEWQYNP